MVLQARHKTHFHKHILTIFLYAGTMCTHMYAESLISTLICNLVFTEELFES